MITGFYACQSQGNLARTRVTRICKDLQIPESAKILDSDILFSKGKYHVAFDRYSSLAIHSGMLAECGQTLVCVTRWTEWERDCKDPTNTIWFKLSGFRGSCDIPSPDC